MDYIDSIIKESKKNLESSPIMTIGELEHPSAEDEFENLTHWTILYLADFSIKDLDEQIAKEEVVGYFDNCRDARRWLDKNAEKKRNDEIYDHYERFIYRDGKKLNYHFLEWSVSKQDKEKGLYKGKIIPKLM